MSGQPLNTPGMSLRSGLTSPFAEMRRTALRIVKRELERHSTYAAAARALGIHERTLKRIRDQHPCVRPRVKRARHA